MHHLTRLLNYEPRFNLRINRVISTVMLDETRLRSGYACSQQSHCTQVKVNNQIQLDVAREKCCASGIKLESETLGQVK